jgi:hypothetical protein
MVDFLKSVSYSFIHTTNFPEWMIPRFIAVLYTIVLFKFLERDQENESAWTKW